MLIKNVFSGLFIVGLMLTGNSVNSQVSVVDLRCELLVEPQGIDCVAPRLSWELVSDARDVQQTKYRILVASSLEKLNANEGDLWDSKNVKSN
ncbi:MAG: hypothetical protein LBD59_02740, partial [Prevotellaceae bacterium]|nr:hypothetical protein [Prevotellaceae bacterium]